MAADVDQPRLLAVEIVGLLAIFWIILDESNFMKCFDEVDIKLTVLELLIRKGFIDEDSVVLNEYTVDNFSRRVDIAVLRNNKFYGFEIKSDLDTLKRLKGQVDKYLDFFDKVIVVVSGKHLGKALEMLPENVAIWEVCEGKIRVARRGRLKAIKNNASFIKLMDVRDLDRLCRKELSEKGSKSRQEYESKLMSLPVSKVRRAAFDSITKKYEGGAADFVFKARFSGLVKSDIDALNLYYSEREEAKSKKEEMAFLWKEFGKAKDRDKAMEAMAERFGREAFGKIPHSIQNMLDD